MKETLKELKTGVYNDWLKEFPVLTKYSINKFYKILGPLIIGIELIKLPHSEEYRPHFVGYPLWKNDLKSCLEFPIILIEFYNKKGFQIDIPYENHKSNFEEACTSISNLKIIPIDGNITLKNLQKLLEYYIKNSAYGASPKSYLYARFLESYLQINLYVNSNNYFNEMLKQINNTDWNYDNFKHFGVDVNEWVNKMNTKIENRESFLNQINLNKQDKKIAKLQISELIF